MSDLIDIYERVKTSRGPSRDLDFDLLESAGIGYYDYTRSHYEYRSDEAAVLDLSKLYEADVPTRSIEHALALVERFYPKVRYEICRNGWGFNAEFWPDDNSASFMAEHHDSAPLAILAALLSALIAKESSNDQ